MGRHMRVLQKPQVTGRAVADHWTVLGPRALTGRP
jgi:hypothetical protein